MKVGIMTLSAENNCGSVLQGYALQEIIKNKYKHSVELINFSSKKSRQMYRFSIKTIVRTLLFGYSSFFNYVDRQLKHIKSYDSFRNNNLNFTKKRYSSLKEFVNEEFDYDIVICGSDQIWNIEMYDFDNAFFLTWVKNAKKVAYAPSFGSLDVFKYPDVIKDYLKDFLCVSTRDDKNCKKLEAILNKKVSLCADPTLLIDRQYWSDLAGDRVYDMDYIFYYSWSYNSSELNMFVSEQAKKFNLPVYVIDARKWYDRKDKNYGFILPSDGGPQIFLKLMKYAKLVFVESFHGVIFSYIFKRNFWLLDGDRNNQLLDPRLNSILEQLGMKKRLIRPLLAQIDDIFEEINYEFIDDSILKEVLEDSFKFLDNIFGTNER